MVQPQKRIFDHHSLECFKRSDTYRRLLTSITQLSDAVVGKPLTHACEVSQPVRDATAVLETMSGWVGELPPQQQQMRYGNPSFKLWHARACEQAPQLMKSLLNGRVPAEELGPHAEELSAYFVDSFGNATRIDYGTGHELSFLAWICCLDTLGVLVASDRPAVVLLLFQRYLLLMRQLQTTYSLEPAGSHGVWGLDDYQFLPFIFGAAQLVGHPTLRPCSIHERGVTCAAQRARTAAVA